MQYEEQRKIANIRMNEHLAEKQYLRKCNVIYFIFIF